MKSLAVKILLCLSFLYLPDTSLSQNASKQQKKAEVKKEKRVQLQKKGEMNARKKHMKIQTKETRKRMKRHKRYAKANNANKKRGIFKRIFGRRER